MADPTPWPGIVVRSSLGETGTVPRKATSNSPDILISGVDPYPDPAFLTDPANYDTYYPNALNIGRPNYLYVRGKNFTDADLSGNWTLYFAEPNILLYPYLWEENKLGTSTNNFKPPFDIKAGAIGASTDPFRWIPPDVSDHYCMLAIAETPGHGNPVAGVSKIQDLAIVVSENGNMAWRNVQMIRGNKPEQIMNARYNQGDSPATVDLKILFRNIPKGSHFNISSGTPLNGQALKYSNMGDPTGTTDFDFFGGWPDVEIPAQWSTMFTAELFIGAGPWPPDNKKPEVEIRAELVETPGGALYHYGVVPEPYPGYAKTRMANGGPVRVIPVGSVAGAFYETTPEFSDA